MYQGALMDVGKLLQQLQRSEKARVDTETFMKELKTENNKLSEKNDKFASTIKSLTGELSDCKKKFHQTDECLVKMTVRIFIYFVSYEYIFIYFCFTRRLSTFFIQLYN